MKLFTISLLVLTICILQGFSYSIRIDDRLEKQRENDTCRICPEGHYSGSFNSNGKTYNCSFFCVPGSCPETVNCTLCPAGQYNDHPNATQCIACTTGHVSGPGQRNCTICKAGTSNNPTKEKCVACLPGTFSPSDGDSCMSCLPGQFNNVSGQTHCFECPKGTYNNQYKQAQCTPCGEGRYNPDRRSKTEEACLTCPAGYYCPSTTTVIPEPCPANSYCPAGTANPIGCPTLFESGKSSDSCQPKVTMYLLMLAGVAAIVIIVSVIVCVKSSPPAENAHMSHKEVTESDRLVRDGPVYEGL
jgi:hypothetical protein